MNGNIQLRTYSNTKSIRQASIYRKEVLAGTLIEDGGEYRFCYDEAYLAQKDAQPTMGLVDKVVLQSYRRERIGGHLRGLRRVG